MVPVQDLTPGALDLVVHVQLAPPEVHGLPRQPQDFPPTQAEAEHQDPGREEVVITRGGIREELARLRDGPGLDPVAPRLGHLHQRGHVLADQFFRDRVSQGRPQGITRGLDHTTGRIRLAALPDRAAPTTAGLALGVFALGAALADRGQLGHQPTRGHPGP